MNRAAVLTLLTMLTLPTVAAAQADGAPTGAAPRVAEPTLSPRMAAQVHRLERVARRTLGCVMYDGGDRGGEEFADARCYDWYDRLERSGVAGAHATGRVLLASLADAEDQSEVDDGQLRLLSLLGSSERPVAAHYLVRALAVSRADRGRSRALAVGALSGLDRLTENDVAPLAPWENPYEALGAPEVRVDVSRAWEAWYAEHAGERRREWREAGLEAARAHLEDDDPRLRFAAIRRLAQNGQAHFALGDSLRAVLAQPGLSAPARRSFARYATMHGLLRQAEVREIIAAATRVDTPRS